MSRLTLLLSVLVFLAPATTASADPPPVASPADASSGAVMEAETGAATEATAPSTPAAEAAALLAPGVHLLHGAFVPGRQPDGNTVVLAGPEGLLVLDTGRHEAHSRRILDLARELGEPVRVVVNTHWHLDHVAGNALLRREVPGLQVWASGALEEARSGFLARYREALVARLATLVETETAESGAPRTASPPGGGAADDAEPGTPSAKTGASGGGREAAGNATGDAARREAEARAARAQERADLEAELARIDAGAALLPDRVVAASGEHVLAGRRVRLGLARGAATAGDIWLLDGTTGVLVAGDLVTLPVPFLDTACPAGWSRALGELAELDFDRLVPGHGPALDRAGFDRYHRAFDALLACAAEEPAAVAADDGEDPCAEGWIADLGPLLPAAERDFARQLLAYYLSQHLRDPQRTADLCGA